MAKPESDAPIKLASASVVRALFVQSVRTKEETASIAGQFGERVKSHIENGNLHGAAFNQAASIFRKAKNNEIKAREHLHQLRYYLELVEEDLDNAGHVGDLDRMSRAAGAGAEDDDGAGEDEAAEVQLAPGSLSPSEALAAFRITEGKGANRKAAAKALDIPALDPDAPPAPPADAAAEPAEKPKRGRKPKQADTAEAAPPPPPAAVPTLADDDDDDIRPGFLKAKDAERKAAAVH